MNKTNKVLAFDVGERRIGVAYATIPPRVAQPLTTLINDTALASNLQKLIADEQPDLLVVGLPRNMQGEKTAQTATVEQWVQQHLTSLRIPIKWQDESLTSVAAETHLYASKKTFNKADVDALAASVILTDYLETVS